MNQLAYDHERAPIFIGAGVRKDEAGILQLAQAPIAAQIMGSYTEPAWEGNDAGGTRRVESWDEAAQAYYNSIGLKNPGRYIASEYLPRTIRRVHAAGQAAVINVSSLKHENASRVLPRLAEWALEMGASGVEINGSCPNEDPKHPLLCMDVDATYEVLEAVRERIGPDAYLIYKVSALPPETILRYKSEMVLPVDAIDTINTIGNQPSPRDPITGRPSIEVNDGLAGQSGPAILTVSRENLRLWVGGRYEVLSIGGVTNGNEVRIRKATGALLVGGNQEFRRSANPAAVAARWAKEYQSLV